MGSKTTESDDSDDESQEMENVDDIDRGKELPDIFLKKKHVLRRLHNRKKEHFKTLAKSDH